MGKDNKISSLTGARFIAIMLIVLAHIRFLNKFCYGYIYITFLCNANLGVDFFFMLSGFGMALSMESKGSLIEKVGIKNSVLFAVNHVRKIYPLYVVTLICGVPSYFFEDIIKYNGTITHALVSTASKFVMSLTLLQSLTGMTKFNHAINGVSWFLSTLFCIYLVSPIALKFVKRRITSAQRAACALFVSILVSYILAIAFNWVDENSILDDLYYGSPYRRFFYVFCGMAIAKLYLTGRKRIPGVLGYISVLASVAWFVMRNLAFERIGVNCVLIDMLICSTVLYVIATNKGKISKVLSSNRFVHLGELSMYIFLTHYMICTYVDDIFVALDLQTWFFGILEATIILVMSFAVAELAYKINRRKLR